MTRPTSGEARWTITQMGAAACQRLAPGERGTVLAALSGAAYLQTAAGEILWLASDGAPMHRRCLKAGAPLPRLRTGASFCVDEAGLRIEPGAVLDCASASLWQPCQLISTQVVSLADVPGRVSRLASILDCAHAVGLGRLIGPMLHGEAPSAAPTDDPLLDRAGPAVLGILDGLRKGDRKRVAECVDQLVGLGAGLTPAGDDFLGGVLFGASALRQAYPGSRFPEVAVPAEPYQARTHPISWTLLADHAQGHGSAPLHAIVNGMLTGAPIESIGAAVHDLVRVGHTTGWDTLAGLVAGLLAAGDGSR